MAIFDAFTGNAQVEGQENARNFLEDIRQSTARTVNEGLNQGFSFLDTSLDPQLASLQSGYNNAVLNYGPYANAARDAIQQGGTQGVASIYDMLSKAINPMLSAANRYGDARLRAQAMAESGLGLTDPAKARAAFQTSPGYEFMLNQGLESIARNANRAGMLASGNQMRESQTYGSGLADKEWDDWMNRLFAREQLYTPAEAGMIGKIGDTYSQAGRSLADLQSQTGRSVGAIYGAQGQDLARLAAQLGQAQSGIYGTLGQAKTDFLRQLLGLGIQANVGLAGGQAQTFVGAGDAEAQASKNIFNALLGAAKLGVGSGGLGSLLGGSSSSTDAKDALV